MARGLVEQKPPKQESAFTGLSASFEEDLYKCVHCGLCLNSCPTYLELDLETESPRGRIALMKAAHEGRIDITKNVIAHWDLCLQCRACEAVCPSGVPYGRLIETVRGQVETRHKRRSLRSNTIYNLAFRRLLPYQGRLELLVAAIRLYQRSGLQRLLRTSRVLKLLPGNVDALEASLPTIPSRFFRATGQVIPAQGQKRATVALLSGCVMPLVHQSTMESTVRVLSCNGCDVIVTNGQGCCGALNAHAGDLDGARRMARRNIDVFLSSGVDAIIVASAGCGASMKEYGHAFRDDPLYAEKAQRFGQMVKDIHEFLVGLPLIPPKARLERRVTYQDSCHLAHAQRIKSAPRDILNAIPGLEFVEMGTPGKCCGAAGSYTVTQRDFSQRLMQSKIEDVASTGADVVASANPGCVLQLQTGVQGAGLAMEATYVVDLLAEAYSLEA